VLPGFGRIGETDCVRIDDGCTGPVCNELWLDPGRDFLPLRLISRVNSEPSILSEMTYDVESDGFHPWKSWTFEFVNEEGQLRFAEAASVTAIRWNPRCPMTSSRSFFQTTLTSTTRISSRTWLRVTAHLLRFVYAHRVAGLFAGTGLFSPDSPCLQESCLASALCRPGSERSSSDIFCGCVDLASFQE
jgi:hypothetical protein